MFQRDAEGAFKLRQTTDWKAAGVAVKEDSVHLLVSALKANTWYKFDFETRRRLNAGERQRLASALRRAVSDELLQNNLTISLLASVKRTTIESRVIPQFVPDRGRLEQAPDLKNALERPLDESLERAKARIFEAQTQMVGACENWHRTANDAGGALVTFLRAQRLRTMAAVLQQDEATAKAIGANTTLLRWLEADAKSLRTRGFIDRETVDCDARELVEGAGFADPTDKYQAVTDTLSKLFSLALRLTHSEAIQKRLDELETAGLVTKADRSLLEEFAKDTGGFSLCTDAIDAARNDGRRAAAAIAARSASLTALDDFVETTATASMVTQSSTTEGFETGQSRYVSADFGFAYVFGIESAAPYAGLNFYFVPVNKDAVLPF
ncbi:MAG: hypothetical protein AB1762_22105, partial [Gemmatimonadota bacterium]